jgi:hypothetical protein
LMSAVPVGRRRLAGLVLTQIPVAPLQVKLAGTSSGAPRCAAA